MISVIFSHLIKMTRMLLSSSCILVLFLCLSHECTGRHLSSMDGFAMDDNTKVLSHSTIKGFENDLLTVHDELNLKMTEKGKDQTSEVDKDHHNTECKSENKKDMEKGQKLKKVQEEPVHRHHHQHHPKSHDTVTFRVPPKNKRVHQQPGFNLDYSPPKTHPGTHN